MTIARCLRPASSAPSGPRTSATLDPPPPDEASSPTHSLDLSLGELEAKLREPLSPGELVRVSQAIRQLTSEREKARAAARAEKAKDAPDPETKHKAAAFVEKMKLMRERHEADAAAAAARGEPLCAVCKGAIGRDTTTAGPRLAQVAAPSAEPETGCRKHNPSGNSLAFYAARSDDEVH